MECPDSNVGALCKGPFLAIPHGAEFAYYQGMPKGSEMGHEFVGAVEEIGSDEETLGSPRFGRDAVHHASQFSLNTLSM